MIEDRHISLAHGNGGRFMRDLIDDIFARHLGNPSLDVGLDAAPIALDPGMRTVMTTDGFTVAPLEFPGGDIGSLAVNGTVNDLAVSGAEPLYLTLGAVIEEGLEIARLDRIVRNLGAAAQDCRLGIGGIRENDAILISGPVGDHGIAIMLARGEFELSGAVLSDCAAVTPLTLPLAANPAVRFMRDPTRGGLATVAHEIAQATAMDVHLSERAIPVRDGVRSVCEILGYDPYFLACEGRVVAIVAPDAAEGILTTWRGLPGGEDARAIGTLRKGRARVILETAIGGARLLDELEDDPLPRIC